MKESEHLKWIHDRIVSEYHESENVDFLIKMRDIINNLEFFENLQTNKPLEKGYAVSPYISKCVSTSINGEVVWYANRWKNFLLKVKHFFYTSENRKLASKYANKKINSKFYTTIKITGTND